MGDQQSRLCSPSWQKYLQVRGYGEEVGKPTQPQVSLALIIDLRRREHVCRTPFGQNLRAGVTASCRKAMSDLPLGGVPEVKPPNGPAPGADAPPEVELIFSARELSRRAVRRKTGTHRHPHRVRQPANGQRLRLASYLQFHLPGFARASAML